MLRGRFRAVSPVLLLAFLLQIFTAGGSGFAALSAGVAWAPICSATSTAEQQKIPPAGHHLASQCCLLCHLPGTIEPGGASGAFTAPALITHLVLWAFDPELVRFTQAFEQARARAPPYIS